MTVIIHLLEYHLDDFLDIHQLTLDCLFFNTAKDIKTSKWRKQYKDPHAWNQRKLKCEQFQTLEKLFQKITIHDISKTLMNKIEIK